MKLTTVIRLSYSSVTHRLLRFSVGNGVNSLKQMQQAWRWTINDLSTLLWFVHELTIYGLGWTWNVHGSACILIIYVCTCTWTIYGLDWTWTI